MAMVSSGAAPSLRPTVLSCEASGNSWQPGSNICGGAPGRQRHQNRGGTRLSCATIQDRRRTRAVRVRLDRADARSKKTGSSATQILPLVRKSGSMALSSLVAAIRSIGRRPTAARLRALCRGGRSVSASSSMMKRRPSPVEKAMSSWRVQCVPALTDERAEAGHRKSCAAFSVPCFLA
jgi:hypothetical protein